MSNFYGSGNYYGNDVPTGGYGGGPQQPPLPPHQQHQQQQQQQPNQQQTFYQPTASAGYAPGGGYTNNNNMQQWQMTSDGQSQQQHYQHQQQQQQQQQPTLSFWNPATVATVASLASASTGGGTGHASSHDAMLLDLAGKTLMHSSGSAARVLIPGFSSSMQVLRPYFAVDNRFVLKKMQKVLFPFVFQNWRRQPLESYGGSDHHNALQPTSYALPHSDENAPDLYLPIMSLISYVLLCALCYGTAGKFNPEVLPDVTTKCFVTQIIEVLMIRCGFYLMQVPVSLLDLLSYTGYKYLGLCVTLASAMLMKMILHYQGRGVYYVTFVWTASAAAFVMLKTMANNIPTVTAATGPKREVMVLAFALLQFAAMWFVSQTKFL